ncbi:hypothetical protein WR25_02684 [Diploscapter pachys]|jgi:hypothetical protein|uniref:Uncharacterized protein n=1 Tax=Diploscapter pachys TaxID=2018661 RepID=A0A2A2K1L3_9BILA|nr:hypothetical protein WR25_02684 [Diploscapter pachys]
MKGLAFVAAGALALAGCAGTHVKKVAVCDGKHRRPANIYGTVLPTLPVPLPLSQTSAQSMMAPGSSAATQPLPSPTAASTPVPVFPEPDAGSTPVPPIRGAKPETSAAPRTSQRTDARSYLSC